MFGAYDQVIVDYTRRLRRHGARVNSKIVMGTARGIVMRRAPQLWRLGNHFEVVNWRLGNHFEVVNKI